MKTVPVESLSNAVAVELDGFHPNVATDPVVTVATISAYTDAGRTTEAERTVLSFILMETFTPPT
jgi:hypothetical protein